MLFKHPLHLRGSPFPLGVLRTSPTIDWDGWGWRPCVPSSHWLKRMCPLASPLCKVAGRKRKGKAQLIQAKDGWPEGSLGWQSGASSLLLPSQHRSRPCKDPSCWITLEFISQFITEAAFSPSLPFLLSRSGRFMGKQGLHLSCLHWHGGWEEAGRGKCTRTPTLGRVVLKGLGWAAGGCPGCWGSRPGTPEPAVCTEVSIISPSLKSGSLPHRPLWEAGAVIMRRNNSSPLSSCAKCHNMRGLM